MPHIDLTSVSFIILVVATILLFIQAYYFLDPYSRLYKHNKRQNGLPDNDNCPPLSVIIVTKDSATALKENLPVILEQDYPDFEVIVINDESAGEDEDVLKILETKYHNLYYTFIPKSARYISRKKLGLSMGIKASKYDWIVITEPYCKPCGKDWLRSLARNFTPGTDIVLGYCNYNNCKGFFAKRITSDTLLNNMRFLGKAIANKAYMGIGKNMAFRKDVYEKHKTITRQLQLLRGEDDLFVNEAANNSNTKVEASTASILRMPLPENKRTWNGEKISYEITGKLYKGTDRLSNAFETWTAILFNASILACASYSIIGKEWITTSLAGLLLIIRYYISISVLKNTSKAMGENIRGFFFAYLLLRPIYSLSLKCKYIKRNKADFMRK